MLRDANQPFKAFPQESCQDFSVYSAKVPCLSSQICICLSLGRKHIHTYFIQIIIVSPIGIKISVAWILEILVTHIINTFTKSNQAVYFIPKCDNSNAFPLDLAGPNLDQGSVLITSSRTGTAFKLVLTIKFQKWHISIAHLSFGLKTTKEQPGFLFQMSILLFFYGKLQYSSLK